MMAASAANKNAKRQWKYAMQKRERKHMQKLSIYNQSKVQFEKAYSNIHQGLNASYSRAQTKLNQIKEKTWSENSGALMKFMQNSKFGDLLASGRSGRSIARMGVLEAGALGRFYAQKQKNLTNAQFAFTEGTKLSRQRAANAQEKEFAKVAFNPSEDVAPPAPVMQNVGMALLGDAIGLAGTIGSFYGSDSRLKKNIKKIGQSIDGYNIYKFEYLDDDKEWIGVLAEEVFKKKPSAVTYGDNGYLAVDYHQIDVAFREAVKHG